MRLLLLILLDSHLLAQWFTCMDICLACPFLAGEYDCIPEGNFYLKGSEIAGDFAWIALILKLVFSCINISLFLTSDFFLSGIKPAVDVSNKNYPSS